MKNKITAAFGAECLEHKENIISPQIHVIDLTRRTENNESFEIYDAPPEGIDTLVIENPKLKITATFFNPKCFRNEHGEEPDNCEGVFYLSDSTNETWVLFLEIKDCDATNISRYFVKAKEQIKTVVQIFRNKKIIANDKRVYANISFPRRNKTDFFSQLIKPGERKTWIDNYKIFINGTNHLKIKNIFSIH